MVMAVVKLVQWYGTTRHRSAGLSSLCPHADQRSDLKPNPSMQGMVLADYQGWFRCPGDGSPAITWSHWSKGLLSADTTSVDLYPDTSELNQRYKLPSEWYLHLANQVSVIFRGKAM